MSTAEEGPLMSLPLSSICALEETDVVVDDGFSSLLDHSVFSNLLSQHFDEYEAASKLQKPMIAYAILEQWRRKNGRLVKYDSKRNLYNDIGDKKARSLISKALRKNPSSADAAPGSGDGDDGATSRQSSEGGAKEISSPLTAVLPTGKEQSQSTASINPKEARVVEVLREDSMEPTIVESVLPPQAKLEFPPKPIRSTSPLPHGQRTISASIRQNTKKNHLYGRREEQERLRQVFEHSISPENSVTDLVIISGESGVGKTALAHSLRSHVHARGGFFSQVKFEEVAAGESLGCYVSIYSGLANSILEMDDKDLQQKFCDKIASAIGNEAVLSLTVTAVPALREVIKMSSQSFNLDQNFHIEDKQLVHATQSVRRLEYVFSDIARAVASYEHPLVVLLDDLHACCEASQPFSDFMNDIVNEHSGIFFIGTFQGEREYLNEFFSQLNPDHMKYDYWELGRLPQEAVHELVTDTLLLGSEQLKTLSNTFSELTGGNALFLLELLRTFQEDDLLVYDEKTNQWKCDDHLIRHHPYLQVQSLRDLFVAKISEQPRSVRETVKIAACMGRNFHEDVVCKLINSKDPKEHCNRAIKAGLLTRNDNEDGHTLAFRHDSIYQAAVSLISTENEATFALKLGKKLWRKVDENEMDKFIFVILGLFLREDIIEEKIEETIDRRAVASLCLQAAEKASKASGFEKAKMYLEYGIKVLGPRKWIDHYDVCLSLHNSVTEANYACGSFDSMDEVVNEVLSHARVFEDTVQARMMKVATLGTTKELEPALENGLETLAMLGEKLPSHPSIWQVKLAILKTRRIASSFSDNSLLYLPTMTDEKKLTAMVLLNIMFLHAYYARPLLSIMISCRMIHLTVTYGVSAVSCAGFAMYGTVIVRGGTNVDEAYRFGNLALQFSERYRGGAWHCRVAAAVYGCINIWKHPLTKCLPQSKHAYRLALGSGDLEYAIINYGVYVWNSLDNRSVTVLESEIRGFVERLRILGHGKALNVVKPLWQLCLNFMGQGADDPTCLQGKVTENRVFLNTEELECHFSLLKTGNMYLVLLAYHFSEFEKAETYAGCLGAPVYKHLGTMGAAYCRLYAALTYIEMARKKGDFMKCRILRAKRHLRVLRRWSKNCPENFLGKQFLVEAELAACQGDHSRARSKYYLAIIQSRDAGILMQEALANERAGKYYLSIGDQPAAEPFIKEACRLYEAWGGFAKLEHLKREISYAFVF